MVCFFWPKLCTGSALPPVVLSKSRYYKPEFKYICIFLMYLALKKNACLPVFGLLFLSIQDDFFFLDIGL